MKHLLPLHCFPHEISVFALYFFFFFLRIKYFYMLSQMRYHPKLLTFVPAFSNMHMMRFHILVIASIIAKF